MATPLMKCGHAAQGTDSTGKPVCVICLGITAGAREVDPDAPNLEGRTARCMHYNPPFDGKASCSRATCTCERPSSTALAFFEHRPDRAYDSYYCGCWGWE